MSRETPESPPQAPQAPQAADTDTGYVADVADVAGGGCPVITFGISKRSLLTFVGEEKFGTILADPPWRFTHRTGKVAPEHKRLERYDTMPFQDILDLPLPHIALPQSHLYLWVPNALILEGLEVMRRWGFTYKTNLVWFKVRKDGGPDGRGVGFYFRNVTELVLFGTRGGMRTLPPGRRQVNLFQERKREHSRKPERLFDIIERCSPGPYIELFARHHRPNWYQWSNEIESNPTKRRCSRPARPRCVGGGYQLGWVLDDEARRAEHGQA